MKIRHHFASAAGVLILTALTANSAWALPLDGSALSWTDRPIYELNDANIDFGGIVALDDCSGSIVRFTTSQPNDKAMVLTNGHCYEGGFLQPGEVITNKDSGRTFDLLSADATQVLGTLNATRVLYATMTSTDVTLYQLTSTYADIARRYDIQPLTIAAQHPTAGTAIRVVSGYWRKIYSCKIDGFVYELKEDHWTFQDSIRYTEPGCDVVGGTSGSPIIDAASGEVIGINNTINENGEKCTFDNPCEVDKAGQITATRGTGYGQELSLFYGCLAQDGSLDLTRPQCLLPKPARL